MSVYLALHTSKSPNVADLRRIGELAEVFGVADDTSPAALDWRDGQVTISLPLDRVLETIRLGKGAALAIDGARSNPDRTQA